MGSGREREQEQERERERESERESERERERERERALSISLTLCTHTQAPAYRRRTIVEPPPGSGVHTIGLAVPVDARIEIEDLDLEDVARLSLVHVNGARQNVDAVATASHAAHGRFVCCARA